MLPVVHGLENQFGDKIDFVYLDIDDAATQTLKNELGYRFQPHFFLVNGDGVVIQQWLGVVSEADFVLAFEQVLQ